MKTKSCYCELDDTFHCKKHGQVGMRATDKEGNWTDFFGFGVRFLHCEKCHRELPEEVMTA